MEASLHSYESLEAVLHLHYLEALLFHDVFQNCQLHLAVIRDEAPRLGLGYRLRWAAWVDPFFLNDLLWFFHLLLIVEVFWLVAVGFQSHHPSFVLGSELV